MSETVETTARARRGKLYLKLGCMKSGKTECIVDEYIAAIEGRGLQPSGAVHCVCFKPAVDTRTPPGFVVTRAGNKCIPAISVGDQSEISSICDDLRRSHPRLDVYIDEGQFIKDLDACVTHLQDMGDDVTVAALNGDRDGKPWETVSALLAICDGGVKLLHAWCDFCAREASFSLMLESDTSGSKVVIDDGTNYAAACGTCWASRRAARTRKTS